MNRRPRLPRSDRCDWRLVLGLLVVTLIVQGCAAPPPGPPEPEPSPGRTSALLGRDQDFAIVIAQAGDDFGALAERYLGDSKKGWWIAEFNAVDQVRAGQDLVIPLRPRNAIGVYANGFQTIPILCYHRFGPNKQLDDGDRLRVRGADGVSRAERLPRGLDDAVRALPRRQGAACRRRRS